VIEMESFWIDHGFAGKPFEQERNRSYAFVRTDLIGQALLASLEERRTKTNETIKQCTAAAWAAERTFHGDRFTGATILLWHVHHVGLHRGHIQAHDRWLRVH
jgi:hypothetical protein